MTLQVLVLKKVIAIVNIQALRLCVNIFWLKYCFGLILEYFKTNKIRFLNKFQCPAMTTKLDNRRYHNNSKLIVTQPHNLYINSQSVVSLVYQFTVGGVAITEINSLG